MPSVNGHNVREGALSIIEVVSHFQKPTGLGMSDENLFASNKKLNQ
jgi:hypothetical protein